MRNGRNELFGLARGHCLCGPGEDAYGWRDYLLIGMFIGHQTNLTDIAAYSVVVLTRNNIKTANNR